MTLKELRKARGLTQKRLAELAGIPHERYVKMELGNSVQREHVEKVLQFFGVFEEEVEGLQITKPVQEWMNHTFTRGAVVPRDMTIVFE